MSARLHLAFYRGLEYGRLVDRVVARHDGGPHSHVEIAFGPTPRLGRPVCCSSSWRDGGVRVKRIRLGGPDDARWDLVPLDATPAQRERVASFCMSRLGAGYDLPGVLALRVRGTRQCPKRWFCSEFCAAALAHAGLAGDVLEGRVPSSLTPNGLYRLLTKEASS